MIGDLLLAVWIGVVALQLTDVVLTASRLPQLSAFSALKAELGELVGQRVPAELLESYRAEIDRLDAKEAARVIPPGRGATEQLWRGTPWRLAPVALTVVGALLVAALYPEGALPVAIASIVLGAVSYVLALAAARASVAAANARATVHEQHRAEIDELLARVARGSRKRVAGLGDRVNRALQILREQQS